jgi:glutamine synthetase
VLKGVIEGVSIQAEIDINAVFLCVQDTEEVAQDLQEAFELLRTNELGKVKDAIRKIGEAI